MGYLSCPRLIENRICEGHRRLLDFSNRSLCRCRLRAVLLVTVVLFVNSIHATASDAPRAQREAAVIQAREGHTTVALAALQALLQQYPDDPRLLADTTIVANWAGNDSLVLDLYSRPQTPKDDGGVVEAAARSARNLHQYDRAIELYRLAQTLDSERWQPKLGEAMVLTDTEDYSPAARLMQPLLRLHGDEKDVILGEAYLCSRQADFTCSIAMYQHYLERFPKDSQVRSDLALALSRIGSHTQAAELYAGVASAVPKTEFMLNGAAAGEKVGWGEIDASNHAQQRAESEAGLELLDNVIAVSAPGEATWRSAQYDRIVALFDLHQLRDVVHAFEALQRQGLEVPAYALRRVAEAYLTLLQPERAEALYRKLLQQSPTDGTVWSGLAYAQMERDHPDEALKTIDHAYKDSPPWLEASGLNESMPNKVRLKLELQAAEMRGDVNLLAEEQKRLQDLLASAPGSENVRWQLATTYLARGWPVRALEESRIADEYAEPDELPSLASAEIHEGAGLRDAVDAMLPALRNTEFDSPALKSFLTDRRIEREWQFDAESIFGWGSGLEVGSSDQHSEAHLSTPLLDNRWRIYAHELSDSGDFQTGSAERTREGAGVHYDYSRQEAWAEVAHDEGTHRMAGSGGAKLSFGDFWTLRAEADTDSFDVPLRAVTGNVHGRSLDLDLGWRASELRSANIGLQRVLFSDGNQRAALSGAWNERLWTTPRLQVSIGAEEYASSNSLNENRTYFNPSHDFSLGPRGTLDWLTWRRYDRSFHQEVDIDAAPYWQQNYGTAGAVAIHYAQRWKLRSGLEGHGGVTWNSQPYDGSGEHRTALEAGITWGSQ
jgi:biofilm PGA synthesis protein PgaA